MRGFFGRAGREAQEGIRRRRLQVVWCTNSTTKVLCATALETGGFVVLGRRDFQSHCATVPKISGQAK